MQKPKEKEHLQNLGCKIIDSETEGMLKGQLNHLLISMAGSILHNPF